MHSRPPAPGAPPCRGSRPALYLEEILGDDGQALGVVGDALQVGVLVQDIVVDVQEELHPRRWPPGPGSPFLGAGCTRGESRR